ncbi:MAG: hypothetical protein Q3993_03750 [Filifactor alocis]|nr:hypothetical protein [Filifactor alocis]
MKKKLAALLLSMTMVLGISGCTPEEKSYLQEIEKVSQWEASESKVDMDLSVETLSFAMGEGSKDKMEFVFKGDAYNLNPKGALQQGVVTFSLKEKGGLVNIPNVKIYMDGANLYISRNYIEGIFKATGEEIPEAVKQAKQEYLLLDGTKQMSFDSSSDFPVMKSNETLKAYIQKYSDPSKKKEFYSKMEQVGDLIGFKTGMKKEGRTFSVDMTSDHFIDQTLLSLDNVIKNLDKILTLAELKEVLQVNDASIKMIQESYNNELKQEIVQVIPEIKEAFAGSKYSTKETFTDKTYKGDVVLNLLFKGFGSATMKVKTDTKKVDPRPIPFPRKNNVIDFEDYMKLYEPPVKDVLIIDKKAGSVTSEKTGKSMPINILEEGQVTTQYQFAPLMKMAGIEYGYDKALDEIYIISGGEKIPQSLYEENGVSYVGKYEFVFYDFEEEYNSDENSNIVRITVR